MEQHVRQIQQSMSDYGETRDEEAAPSALMVQVGGAQGPILVFRLWAMTDLKEAIKQLPPATEGGENLARELLLFCHTHMPAFPEIKILLSRHLTPSQFVKLREAVLCLIKQQCPEARNLPNNSNFTPL